ncbi:MAG: hypothetical protein CL607_21870 [Anaerolineaceae bacterium]|nr:hypothetical protein [Anaerolineaceae bacterium]
MAQDIDLLIAMAEIAGIFVGFGALISVIRRNEIDSTQLGQIRAVVTIGLVVMVAALVPVGISRFGVEGHDLWFVCSLVFLGLTWVVNILSLRDPENRELLIRRTKASPVMTVFFWLLLEVPMQIPLVLTVLGLYPHLEPAFYITSLVLNQFQAAFVLAQLVYSQANTPSNASA